MKTFLTILYTAPGWAMVLAAIVIFVCVVVTAASGEGYY